MSEYGYNGESLLACDIVQWLMEFFRMDKFLSWVKIVHNIYDRPYIMASYTQVETLDTTSPEALDHASPSVPVSYRDLEHLFSRLLHRR